MANFMKIQRLVPKLSWQTMSLDRLFRAGVLLRMYTVIMSGLYSYTSLYQSDMPVYKIAHANEFAETTMIVLGILCVLSLVDLLINDLMSQRFVLHRALHDRHLVQMAIAGCFTIQMWTCVQYNLSYAVLPFYAVYALMVPLAAFADVRKRFMVPK